MENNRQKHFLAQKLLPPSGRQQGQPHINSFAADFQVFQENRFALKYKVQGRHLSPLIQTITSEGKSLCSPCTDRASNLPAQNMEENFPCIPVNGLSQVCALCWLY